MLSPHHPYGHFRLPKTIQHFLQLSSNYIKPEQTSVFGANLVLLRAASTNWALVRKLQQPDNNFFFTDTISSVLSRLWALCTSRFTSDKRQGDPVLPFHLFLQMPLAGQRRWTLLWVQGKADSDDVQGMHQESPVWTRKCLGTSHVVGEKDRQQESLRAGTLWRTM